MSGKPGTPGGIDFLGPQGEAQALADRLPDLLVEALRLSATVAHGLHGRRRAGPGETFWQFRPLQSHDAVQLIDWRRSASSDQLFVREREWEAAHTFWLWCDLSPSMAFRSELTATWKRDRALVLTLAAADLLVRAGERVGLLGLTRPTSSRRAAARLAEELALRANSPTLTASLPPPDRLARYTGLVMVSDFLDPPDEIAARLRTIAGPHVSGHLIQVLDPAEETLPYTGRAEFQGMEGSERWLAERAETLRSSYQRKLHVHRDAIAAAARGLGWSFLLHHTDRSAAEPLLALIALLKSRDAAAAMPRPPRTHPSGEETAA